MLNNQIFYHGIIRKTVVGFGNLFSNISIERRQEDSVKGPVIQTIKVPIQYAPKEKWLVRIDEDPSMEGNVYITLPRMSFEIIGYTYDAQRKVSKMARVGQGPGSMYAPVPYNLDFSLYILTKTQEDGLQIIEQIMPMFGPEYTLSINAIPELDIVQDIPVTLNSVMVSDEYDGDFQIRRFVTHTLNFTVKINLYGPTETNRSQILHTDTFVGFNDDFTEPSTQHQADGDPDTGEITDSWTEL